MDCFVHESSYVDEGAVIGKGTKIWHFSHVLPGARIGENCNIGQNVSIAGGTSIGNGLARDAPADAAVYGDPRPETGNRFPFRGGFRPLGPTIAGTTRRDRHDPAHHPRLRRERC